MWYKAASKPVQCLAFGIHSTAAAAAAGPVDGDYFLVDADDGGGVDDFTGTVAAVDGIGTATDVVGSDEVVAAIADVRGGGGVTAAAGVASLQPGVSWRPRGRAEGHTPPTGDSASLS